MSLSTYMPVADPNLVVCLVMNPCEATVCSAMERLLEGFCLLYIDQEVAYLTLSILVERMSKVCMASGFLNKTPTLPSQLG